MKKQPGRPPSARPDRQPEDEFNFPPGALHAKFADAEYRAKIQGAHIIVGVDSRTGEKSLFFGRKSLERIVQSGEGKNMIMMHVPVDFETDDVEMLCAACQAIKGSYCYDDADRHGPQNPEVN
jgi:hypothetical protein